MHFLHTHIYTYVWTCIGYCDNSFFWCNVAFALSFIQGLFSRGRMAQGTSYVFHFLVIHSAAACASSHWKLLSILRARFMWNKDGMSVNRLIANRSYPSNHLTTITLSWGSAGDQSLNHHESKINLHTRSGWKSMRNVPRCKGMRK